MEAQHASGLPKVTKPTGNRTSCRPSRVTSALFTNHLSVHYIFSEQLIKFKLHNINDVSIKCICSKTNTVNHQVLVTKHLSKGRIALAVQSSNRIYSSDHPREGVTDEDPRLPALTDLGSPWTRAAEI